MNGRIVLKLTLSTEVECQSAVNTHVSECDPMEVFINNVMKLQSSDKQGISLPAEYRLKHDPVPQGLIMASGKQ
jgi:hypothetical protein